MRDYGYVPGSVPTAIGNAGVAMVRGTDPGTVMVIHRRARSVHNAVELLTDLGLPALPDFALAQVDSTTVTVLIRGDFILTVETLGSRTETDGRHTEPWAEVRVPLDDDPRIVVGLSGAKRTSTLPVHRGVVLADSVVVTEGAQALGPCVTDPADRTTIVERDTPQIERHPQASDVMSARLHPKRNLKPAGTEPIPVPSYDGPPDLDLKLDFEPGAVAPPHVDEDRFSAAFGQTVIGRRPEDAAVRGGGVDPSPIRVGPPAIGSSVPSPPQTNAASETVVYEPLQDVEHSGGPLTGSQVAATLHSGGLSPSAPSAPSVTPKATLTLPTGDVLIEGIVVLGRSPRARQASSMYIPQLVTVDNPYVSSTHLEVRFQGNELQVTDLSRNGTLIRYPGESASRTLQSGVPTRLSDGCELELTEDLVVSVRIGAWGG